MVQMLGDYGMQGHAAAAAYECCKSCGRPITPAKELNGAEFVTQGVRYKGNLVRMALRERQVLFALAKTPGQTVHKDAIYRAFYGTSFDANPKIIEVIICNLRRKLRNAEIPIEIKTAWGTGYFLQASPVGN